MRRLVPRFIVENYKQKNFSGQMKVVSLFVDISGFTEMTETLMQHGKIGAEILADALEQVFAPLIGAVYEQKGFITTFAGDAFTALFPIDEALPDTTYCRAFSAAYAIQKYMIKNPEKTTDLGQFTFAVKIGLADGVCEWGVLRSQELPDQYTYYFKGDAIDNCVIAEHLAHRGDLIINKSVLNFLRNQITYQPVDNAFFLLTDFTGTLSSPNVIEEWQPTEEELIAFLPPEVVHMEAKGEFRQVVTLFLGFKGVEDKDVLDNIMQPIFTLSNKYRGCIARLDFGDKGCNVLLFWGAPIRHENDAERALDFLLDLKEIVSVEFRVGMTYGQMFAGFSGADLRSEYTCYGRRINLAARMMMKAFWGQLWIDGNVAQKAQAQFDVSDEKYLNFKGFREPLSISSLIGRKTVARTIFYEGKMVGRRKEMAKLHRFIQPIFSQSSPCFSGIFYVYGEAGIGKTRLIHEFRQQILRQKRIFWLSGHCDEILRQSLNPFQLLLRRYFEQTNEQFGDQNRKIFTGKLNSLISQIQTKGLEEHQQDIVEELHRASSILAGMLDVHFPDSLYSQLPPKLRFENKLVAFKTFIQALSLLHPVIIFLDDLQWIDDDSKKLIRLLCRNMEDYPVAVLCTSRYNDNGNKFNHGIDKAVPQHIIDLNYLSYDSIKDIAEQVVGGSIRSEVVDFLLQKTEGNPFFVEQMTLDLREQNYLINGTGTYALAQKAMIDVPTNIDGVLVSRLDRLSLPVKNVVQTASVLGWEFETRILENMLSNDPRLEPKMKTASQAAIWSAKTEVSYIFKHALMRDAAYNMQLKSRLRNLHQLAAKAFEVMFAEDSSSHYADLALHYEKAQIEDKAIEYLQKAADYARENYQNQQALDLYDKLLSHLVNNDKFIEMKILNLLKKGRVLKLIGDWDDAITVCDQALKLADEAKSEALMGNSYQELGWLSWKTGKYDNALKFYETALKIGEKFKDKKRIGSVAGNMGLFYWSKGEYISAMTCYENSLQISLELDDKENIAINYGNMGLVYNSQGDYSKAMECFDKALAIEKAINNRSGISRIMGNIGAVYLRKGNLDEAMKYYQEKMVIDKELGDKEGVSATMGNIGIIYRHRGDYDKAMMYYQKNLAINKELGDKSEIANILNNIGVLYWNKGEYEKVIECFTKKLKIDEELNNKQGIAIAVSNMGEVYIEQKDYKTALDCYNRSISIEREIGDRYGLAYDLLNKTQILFDLQEYREALPLCEEGLEIAQQININDQIAKGKELLEKIKRGLQEG